MDIKTKYFKKIDFWARELRLPLFWLTDSKHNIVKEGALVLYKNNIIHVYHLDDIETKLSDREYKFFFDKLKAASYKKRVDEIRDSIKQIVNAHARLKVHKLTDKELEKRVFELISFLDDYSNTYSKTEPIALSKIEAEEERFKELIKELGEMRFALRKDGELLFYNLFGVFLKEAAKRFKLKVADLFFYTFEELINLFKGKKVKSDKIERRKKGYALVCLKNRKILLVGTEFKDLYKKIILTKPKADHLEGRIAMTGKAKGKVRVILHNKRNIIKEVEDFKKGEILVTEMTRPDTILACKKAAAIITDEGGITSHAAIISRELKIPCVIATKIATQILKTGDMVEVDADKGFIKILKTK
ncbi:MAG: PEP-utilizing enzyme [Patescibacteria group bacterium]